MFRIFGTRGAFCAVMVLGLLVTGRIEVSAAEKRIWWDDGGGDHKWTTADNWDAAWGGGPANDGYWEFVVTIGCHRDPNDATTTYDPVDFDPNDTPVEITDFFLCTDSRLVLKPYTDLTVLRTTEIDGIIDGQGGNFTAPDDPNFGSADFNGDRTRIWAADGSVIWICASTYSSEGLPFTEDILMTDGVGTAVLLPCTTNISTAFDDGSSSYVRYHAISATSGGEIDLSGMTQIDPPKRGEDYVQFILRDASSMINLNAMERTQDPNTTSSGYAKFVVSDCAVQQLPALIVIDDTLFDLTSGAQLHVNGPSDASYSSAGMPPWSHTIMSADGVGENCENPTLLDLSAVTSLSTAFDDGSSSYARYHAISATSGGEIDLSGVTHIDPPHRPEDYARFTIEGAGANGRSVVPGDNYQQPKRIAQILCFRRRGFTDGERWLH